MMHARCAFGAMLILNLFGAAADVQAQVVAPEFAADYSMTDLGSVPGVPPQYGGLFILASDPASLYIGGEANGSLGALYRIALVRDGDDDITGFSGTAVRVADAPYNDGGITLDPGGHISYAQWPSNGYGQIDLATGTVVNQIDLTPLGVASASAMVAFIPAGFPGAGGMRIASWSGGEFYEVDYSVDPGGIIGIASVTAVPASTLPGGPEGWAYVPSGSPQFAAPSMIVSEYGSATVSVFEMDATGNPVIATRRDFITGLDGAEGAAFDPVSGAYLFSTFGGGDHVIVVEGFAAPTVANATLLPASLDFGDVAQGATSPAQALTLSSTGTAPLEIAGADTVGDWFAVASTCPVGLPGLAPGESCTIEITCSPDAIGPQAGSYNLATNAGALQSTLQCNGISGAAGTLSPAALDFGGVPQGTTSVGQVLTLASTGTAPLQITNAAASGDWYGAASTCPIGAPGLAPGESCTIEVTCSPDAVGPQAGSYDIETDAGTLQSTLQCNGISGAAGNLSPAALDFGDVPQGTTSAGQVLTFASTGSGPLQIISAGASGSWYDVVSTCPIGAPGLAPGASCTIDVTCSPDAAGLQAGSYSLATDAGAFESTMQCSGIATGPGQPVQPVPTRSPAGIAALIALLALVGTAVVRARRPAR